MRELGIGDDILDAAVQGDPQAWGAIVDVVLPLTWKTITGAGIAGSDAADVSQVVWLRVAQHLERFASVEALAGWAATMAALEARRRVRQLAARSAEEARRQTGNVVQLKRGFVVAPAGAPNA